MVYNSISEEVRKAADAYLDGSATAEQEKELHVFLATTENLPEDFKALKTMLAGFSLLSDISFDTAAFAEKCKNKATRKGPAAIRWAAALAAAAAVVLSVWLFTPQKQSVYGYDIYGQAIVNMEDALANIEGMNLLSEFSSTINEAENIVNQLIGDKKDYE
ncbi:MAG: hypothetical protein Q4G10_00170 [Bacteroidia bacterium]|nr:hypothetical protein [Bacteroidia bacterium]